MYARWVAAGRHAGMDYMTRYDDVRSDPRLLLPGARSLIVCAFSYFTDTPFLLPISLYARGRDYHEVIRTRLTAMADRIATTHGGETRICIDTAPLRERYWAQRAGLGFIGLNNQLIVPGTGSYVFLGTILWTGHAEPTAPTTHDCGRCGRCVAACPAHALSADGRGLDAHRCLSYLTIEHRGEFPNGTNLCGHLYGCDECQRVCPHNRGVTPTSISEFYPTEALATLTLDKVSALTQPEFSTLFRHSAIKRTKLAGLQRNAASLHKND